MNRAPSSPARRALLAGAALCCAGGEAAATAAWPRSVVDASGRTLRLAAPPQRIVAIFPSNIEIVFALGLEARVAAIGGRVRHPEAALAKPSVGGALGYSPEAVAALRPDLIVLTPSHGSALGLVEPFERAGVAVLVLAHPDLAAVRRNIELVGRTTGSEAAAAALLTRFDDSLAAIRQAWQGRPQPSVYLETAAAARGAYQTVGRGHYADDALACAGGRNVFADLAGAQQVSAEAVLLRDPEVIVSLQAVPKPVEEIAARPGWSRLRAVREGRVVVLPRSHFLIPGPRQTEAVLAYARALHPQAFGAAA